MRRPTQYVDALPTAARAIPGFPGYFVTPSGEIYRNKIQRMSTYVSPRDGRERVALSVDGNQTPYFTHTCVALAFIGPRPTPEHQVRHLDGDKANNGAENLAWGLPVDNAADREQHGNTARGERSGSAKITADIVLQIRELRSMGISQRKVAANFGVSKHCVYCIEAGKTWRHVVVPQRGNREAAREAGRRAGAA
jgi:hypothetical protein